MARATKTQDQPDALGAAREEVARGQEDVTAALAARVGPRDALMDPQPTDIIPDNDEKGYHVGEIRQPAEPVLDRSGDVRFETIGDEPSKFETGNLKALKAAHNEREASDEAYAGVLHQPDALSDPYTEEADRARREGRTGRTVTAEADVKGTGGE